MSILAVHVSASAANCTAKGPTPGFYRRLQRVPSRPPVRAASWPTNLALALAEQVRLPVPLLLQLPLALPVGAEHGGKS